MIFSSIICLDDLLRNRGYQSKNFFYDLLREPIKQATQGYNIKSSPHNSDWHNLTPGFEQQRFLKIAKSGKSLFWNRLFRHIPKQAQEYLLEYIPNDALILSYEMPPWLEEILVGNHIAFIDIRLSPLRFGSDLYIALRTNHDKIRDAIVCRQIPDEEFFLEAGLLSAAVRLMRRGIDPAKSFDGTLVYVGQTASDTSLLDETGKFIRLECFLSEIVAASKEKKVVYASHPYGKNFGLEEQALLSKTLGRKVEVCHEDIYEMLGSEEKVEFIGISSGCLQEARWFNKPAVMLYKPICPILPRDGARGYLQIHFREFVSPIFWHSLCSTDMPLPTVKTMGEMGPNAMRRLHNLWWGYSAYLLKRNRFFKEAFLLSGGREVNDELQKLKNTVKLLEKRQKVLEEKLNMESESKEFLAQ